MRTEPTVTTDRHDVKPVYDWDFILRIAAEHRREITLANIIAILATISSVPVPLLLPLLVDEVLAVGDDKLSTLGYSQASRTGKRACRGGRNYITTLQDSLHRSGAGLSHVDVSICVRCDARWR